MAAVATYVPTVTTGHGAGAIVHIAGQGPFRDGDLEHVGRIGDEIGVEQARASAVLVTLNVLAQAAAAAELRFGRPALERISCLRLGVFLNCIDGLGGMDRIADAASDLVLTALGPKGRHCRTVAGMPVLPMRTSVEIDGIFLLD